MKSYRIYIVEPGGRLQLGQAFEAAEDAAAAGQAQALVARGQRGELWEGGRLVGRISPAGEFAPSRGGS